MAETDPREFYHQEPPLPPPPPQQHPGLHHNPYNHYAEEQGTPHVQQPPHPQHPPHRLHNHHDGEQPLDLSMPSRSSRPTSAGPMSSSLGAAKRSMMEEPPGSGSPRSRGHVCMVKGCGCQNALPLHHPHHAARLHRHSPYPLPQQYSPPHGHRSPGLSEAQTLPPHTYAYPHYQYPTVSSSQPILPDAYYTPESPDLRSGSPYVPGVIMSSSSLSPYPTEMGVRPHSHSPSAGLLGLPPRSSGSPLSVSPRPALRDLSPRLHDNQVSPRSRDVSPRPLYRPYEDVERSFSETSSAVPVVSSSTMLRPEFRTASDADLSASSSLLLLSDTATAMAARSTPPAAQSGHYPNAAWEEREREMTRYAREAGKTQSRHSPMEKSRDHHESGTPSMVMLGHRGPSAFQQQTPVHNTLPPPPPSGPAPPHLAFARSLHAYSEYTPSAVQPGNTVDNPQEDGSRQHSSAGAAQEQRALPDLISSSKLSKAEEDLSCPSARRPMTVTGTTALAELRAHREKEKAAENAQSRKARPLPDPSDRENTNVSSSSGDNSDNSLGRIDGSIKPPDPNLKMSPLDYLISEVLVTRIDVPFKPCNTEIKKNFRINNGKMKLLDLIELQVEQSLKA